MNHPAAETAGYQDKITRLLVVIPAKAGIQREKLDSASSAE